MWSSTRKLVRGDASISSVEGTLPRGEEIETWKLCKLCLFELELKAGVAVQGVRSSQKIIWGRSRHGHKKREQRNSDIALYESNLELESLYHAENWKWEADSSKQVAQEIAKEFLFSCPSSCPLRLYSVIYAGTVFARTVHLDMLTSFFHRVKKKLQEIDELRRICCEETDRARQLKIDELSMQLWVSSWLKFRQDVQNEVNFFGRRTRILRSWNSEQLSQLFDHSEFQGNASPRFWIAAWYTEFYGTSENVFWKPTCSRRTILSFLRKFTSCGLGTGTTGNMMEHGTGVRQELQSSSTPTTFLSGITQPGHLNIILEELTLKMVWWIIRDIHSRKCISENSWTQWTFNLGKSTSRRSVGKHTLSYTYNVVDQKRGDCNFNGRTCDIALRFTRWRYAWCDDCVCIEEASYACALPKRGKCRREASSESRPILTREAYCLHDLLATGA